LLCKRSPDKPDKPLEDLRAERVTITLEEKSAIPGLSCFKGSLSKIAVAIFNSEYENPLKRSTRKARSGIVISSPWEGT
jgi:hypothetical protein